MRPPSVLVVDDDPTVRDTIRWALEDEGYRIVTAADGPDAIEQPLATLDLVVLDVTLPGLDGYAVADRLRQMYGAVPILAITGDGQAAAKGARMGAYRVVRKPFDVAELLDAVRAGLR